MKNSLLIVVVTVAMLASGVKLNAHGTGNSDQTQCSTLAGAVCPLIDHPNGMISNSAGSLNIADSCGHFPGTDPNGIGTPCNTYYLGRPAGE